MAAEPHGVDADRKYRDQLWNLECCLMHVQDMDLATTKEVADQPIEPSGQS